MREMKDSGVAWIGAVPSDFAISSIGSLFTIKKDIAGREPETVLSITQTGIRPKDLSSNEGQNASSYAHYQIVNVGDFATTLFLRCCLCIGTKDGARSNGSAKNLPLRARVKQPLITR